MLGMEVETLHVDESLHEGNGNEKTRVLVLPAPVELVLGHRRRFQRDDVRKVLVVDRVVRRDPLLRVEAKHLGEQVDRDGRGVREAPLERDLGRRPLGQI